MARSVSDYESVESSGLRVLVADQSVFTLSHSLALDVKKRAEISEELHLIAVVLSVVLDVPLVAAQVFH